MLNNVDDFGSAEVALDNTTLYSLFIPVSVLFYLLNVVMDKIIWLTHRELNLSRKVSDHQEIGVRKK